MEEKVLTIPSTSEEMTLRQLMHLLTGNVQALLEMTDDELEHADLDDLQRAMDTWNKIELVPSKPFDNIVGNGQRFVLNSMLYDWTFGERMIMDEAMASPVKNLHMLIALHTRPAQARRKALQQMSLDGASIKKLTKVVETRQKWFPLPYKKAELYQRAELFLDAMTAAQALYISQYFSILAIELIKEYSKSLETA